jgi:hypothetical protein
MEKKKLKKLIQQTLKKGDFLKKPLKETHKPGHVGPSKGDDFLQTMDSTMGDKHYIAGYTPPGPGDDNVQPMVLDSTLESDAVCGMGNEVGGVVAYESFTLSAIETAYISNAAIDGYNFFPLGPSGGGNPNQEYWEEQGVITSTDPAYEGMPCMEDVVLVTDGYLCCSGNNGNAYDVQSNTYDVQITTGMDIAWGMPFSLDTFTDESVTCVCETPEYCCQDCGDYDECPDALQESDGFDEETIYLIGCGNTHDYTTFQTFMIANSPNGLGGNEYLGAYTTPDIVTNCAQGGDNQILGCLDDGFIQADTTLMPNDTSFNYSSPTPGVQACNYGTSFGSNANPTDGVSNDLANIDFDNGAVCDYSCHGCTDVDSIYYDAEGYDSDGDGEGDSPFTSDDGSCIYWGCTNPLSDNYCCPSTSDNFGNDSSFQSPTDLSMPEACSFPYCNDPTSPQYICTIADHPSLENFPEAQELYAEIAALLCVENATEDGWDTIPGNFTGECEPAVSEGDIKCGDASVGIDGNTLAVNYQPLNYGLGETSCGDQNDFSCCIYRICADAIDNAAIFGSGYTEHPAGQLWIEYTGPTDGEDAWTGTGNGIQDDNLCLNIGCTGGYEVFSAVWASEQDGIPGYFTAGDTGYQDAEPGTTDMFTGLYASDPDSINTDNPLYYYHPDNDGCQASDTEAPNPLDTSCCVIFGCTDPDADGYNDSGITPTYDPNGQFDDGDGTILGGSCSYEQFGCTNQNSVFNDFTGQAEIEFPEEIAINEFALNFDPDATDNEAGTCTFCKDVYAYQCDPPLPDFELGDGFSIDNLAYEGAAIVDGYIVGSQSVPRFFPCMAFYDQNIPDQLNEPVQGDRFEENGAALEILCCNNPDACNYWEDLDAEYAAWCSPGYGVSDLSSGVIINNGPADACVFPEAGYYCDGTCIDVDADGNCDVDEQPGCADQGALNYNANADGCDPGWPDNLQGYAQEGNTSCCNYDQPGCPLQNDVAYESGNMGCPDSDGFAIIGDTSCCQGPADDCYTCPQSYDYSILASFDYQNWNGYYQYGDLAGGYRIPYGTTGVSGNSTYSDGVNYFNSAFYDHDPQSCIVDYFDEDIESPLNPCCKIPMYTCQEHWDIATNLFEYEGVYSRAMVTWGFLQSLWDQCGVPIGSPIQDIWGCDGSVSNFVFWPDDNCGNFGDFSFPACKALICFWIDYTDVPYYIGTGASWGNVVAEMRGYNDGDLECFWGNSKTSQMEVEMKKLMDQGKTLYATRQDMQQGKAITLEDIGFTPDKTIDPAQQTIDTDKMMSSDLPVGAVPPEAIDTPDFAPKITSPDSFEVLPDEEEEETIAERITGHFGTVLNPQKLDIAMLEDGGKRFFDTAKRIKQAAVEAGNDLITEASILQAITPPANWIDPKEVIAEIKIPTKVKIENLIKKGLLKEGHGGPHSGDSIEDNLGIGVASWNEIMYPFALSASSIPAVYRIISVSDAADPSDWNEKAYKCCPGDTDCGDFSSNSTSGNYWTGSPGKPGMGGGNPYPGKTTKI